MSDAFNTVETRLYEVRASDGVRLTVHRRRPVSQVVRGTILSLHGIQSHSGWYVRSAEWLAREGWDVWQLDRRGSGVSGGERGHAAHRDRLVNDVVQVLNEVRSHAARGPVVLQAVSWGGKLAAVVAAERPELMDALVLLYPGICARIGPGIRQRMLLRVADLLGARRRRVMIPLDDPTLFTSDPAWQQKLREDPVSLRTATTGFLIADQQLTRQARACGPEIHCPTLLILAGRDRIIDNAGMRRYFETIASPDKRLIEFSDAAHTLEFEPCFEEFVQQFLAWLNSHEKSPVVATTGL